MVKFKLFQRTLTLAAAVLTCAALSSVLTAQQPAPGTPAPAGSGTSNDTAPAAAGSGTSNETAPKAAPSPAKPANEVVVTTPLAPLPGEIKYDQLPYAPVFKGEDAAKRIQDGKKFAARTVNDSSLSWGPSVQSPLQTWLVGYMFPALTELNAKQLPVQNLTDIQSQLVQGYLQRVKSKEAHDFMVKLTLDYMKRIASGNYHPASRYNAMLIIGQLNTDEAVLSGDSKQLPRAHLPALGFMVQTLSDPKQVDVLKVAALIGIGRHAYLDGQRRADQRMPGAAKNAVLGPVFKLASQDKPPAGRSAEGHMWLRREAIRILGDFRDVGINNNVANLLESIYKDVELPVSFRLVAATSFAKLEFPPAAKINPAQHAVQVAQIAADVARQGVEDFKAEVERRKEEAKLLGNGAGGMGEGYSPGGGIPEFGGPSEDFGALGGPEFGGPGSLAGPGYGTEGGTLGPVLSPEEQRLKYRVDLMRRKMMANLVNVQKILLGSSQIEPGLRRYVGSRAVAPAAGARPANPDVTYETYLVAVDKAIDKVMDAGMEEGLTLDKIIEELESASGNLSTEVRRLPPNAKLENLSTPPPVIGGPDGEGPGGPGPAGPGPGGPGPGGPGGATLDGPGAASGGPGAGPGTLDMTPPDAGGPGAGPGGP